MYPKQTRVARSKLAIFIAVFSLLLGAAVLAYSSGARDSLLKSRDQVADQRFKLEKAYDEMGVKIRDLQQQQGVIGRYLADCDRSLRELDRALAAQDRAYRDMR